MLVCKQPTKELPWACTAVEGDPRVTAVMVYGTCNVAGAQRAQGHSICVHTTTYIGVYMCGGIGEAKYTLVRMCRHTPAAHRICIEGKGHTCTCTKLQHYTYQQHICVPIHMCVGVCMQATPMYTYTHRYAHAHRHRTDTLYAM